MTIAKRLFVSFSIVIAALIALAALAAYELNIVSNSSSKLLKANVLLQKVATLDREVRLNTARSIAIGFSDGGVVLSLFQKDIDASKKIINLQISEIENSVISAEGQQIFLEQIKLLNEWSSLQDEMLKSRSEGDIGAARELLQNRFIPIASKLEAISQKMNDLQSEETAFAKSSLDKSFKQLYQNGGIVMVIGLLISIYSSSSVSRYVISKVIEIKQYINEIGKGNLAVDVNLSGQDEFTDIMRETQSMQNRLKEIVGSVQEGAGQVALASAEIAQGNMSLSVRTENQASTVASATFSIEHLVSLTEQNAQNANRADILAKDTMAEATSGRHIANGMLETMSEINSASKKISDITGLIDSLAFQTNILALNAAVEAARAGDHGRGFAVVASEVRTLASRSAEAAKGIRTLIDDSVSRVTSGNDQISKVGESMHRIAGSIDSLAELVTEVNQAGSAQTQEIRRVMESIKYIEDFTQENAALVEEMASAAASTGRQADELLNASNFFRISNQASIQPLQVTLAS